jgi:hypothetical protein
MYKEKYRERKLDIKNNPLDMLRFITMFPCSFPGLYEHIAVMYDNSLVCSSCVKENYKEIYHDTKNEYKGEWHITACICENELEDCTCSHCNKSLGYQTYIS